MPFTLIRGSYQVLKASPDGDSVRFVPDDPTAWSRAGIAARTNASGGAQLRLDAIDALETHYTPRTGPRFHQPAGLAGAASGRLLALLGFTGVERTADGTVTAAEPTTRPGAVLTRFADTYGRPVALAYPDGAVTAEGEQVFVDVPLLRASTNAQLLAEGLVYPTFYSRLFADLRAELTATTSAAREKGLGLWAQDVTTDGFVLTSRAQLQDEIVLLPKLFRRLADYLALQSPDDVDLGGFDAFLAMRDDRVFVVPDGHDSSLDSLVSVDGQNVRLTLPPERLVFLEG